MDWLDISTNAWLAAYMMISLIIPALIILGIARLFGRSAKKTVRAFKK